MKLHELRKAMTTSEWRELAAKVDRNPTYLHHLATRFRGCRPSFPLMMRLVAADNRLSLADLAEEFADDKTPA